MENLTSECEAFKFDYNVRLYWYELQQRIHCIALPQNVNLMMNEFINNNKNRHEFPNHISTWECFNPSIYHRKLMEVTSFSVLFSNDAKWDESKNLTACTCVRSRVWMRVNTQTKTFRRKTTLPKNSMNVEFDSNFQHNKLQMKYIKWAAEMILTTLFSLELFIPIQR